MAKATTEQMGSVAKWQAFDWKHPFEIIQRWNQIKWDKVFGNGILSIWVNIQLPHSLKLPNVKIEFKWNYIVISTMALFSVAISSSSMLSYWCFCVRRLVCVRRLKAPYAQIMCKIASPVSIIRIYMRMNKEIFPISNIFVFLFVYSLFSFHKLEFLI